MIELLKTQSSKTIGIRCSGKLNNEDYKKVLPEIENAIKQEGPIRLLAHFNDFHGWDMHAALDELILEVKHASDFDKIAIIGDQQWEKWMAKLPQVFTTAKVKYFDTSELDQAWIWLEDDSFFSYH